MKTSIKLGFCLGIGLVLLTSGWYQRDEMFLQPTDKKGSMAAKDDPTVIRGQNVVANLAPLEKQEKLVIPLPDKSSLTLIPDRREPTAKGFTWFGKIEKEPGSTAVFTVAGKTVVGNITTQSGKGYQLRYIGNGVHVLNEVDLKKFPNEAKPLQPKLDQDPGRDTCSTDPPSDIDVMVVYTADARTAAGGTDAMEAEVYLAVADTNLTYVNSNVTQRLRLVHTQEVAYTESGASSTDLTRLQNTGDGFLDTVLTLRNSHGADIVILIVENLDACGRAYIMSTVSNAMESFAYGVVKRSCASGNHSFAHELGHIMSARHDWPTDPTDNSPYHFNHGYFNTSPSDPSVGPWRTVMSYQTMPASTRLAYWSNPFINYPPGPSGDPMGQSGEPQPTDNHQTLNNTALTVANFRCSSPATANVWMKDTWKDTGVEPDPNTAGEEMWKSPYIWVRNTQDASLISQHQHQNPVAGSTNWVYTKLHNGFNAATNGDLKLYWANASTGLSWPGDWTEFASIPVASVAAYSTRVIEAKWDSVPGPGHFCLLARWVSASDPMTNPETTSIEPNVRNNNNIIWRNVNIVAIGPDRTSEASFIVPNVQGTPTTTLVIRSPAAELATSFISLGRVRVRFDEPLMKAWKAGGSKGKGFKTEEGEFLLIEPTGAMFENLKLDRNTTGRVKLQFQASGTTPKRRFLIDAIQYSAQNDDQAPGKVIGGVSYEVHTDKSSK